MPYPTIIALTGFATAGKTTVAKMLVDTYGWQRMSFAARLKEMAADGYRVNGDMWYWDGVTKGPLERAHMQHIGDVERAKNPLVFVWPIIHALAKADGPVVIDDCRYRNEWLNLVERGAHTWRIVKPDVGPVNSHRSETEHLRFDGATIIHNNSDLAALAETVAWHLAEITQRPE